MKAARVLLVILLLGATLRAQDVSGTLTNTGDIVNIPIVNTPSAAIQLGGTGIGVQLFEYTVDGGTTWNALRVTVLNTGEIVQAATGNVIVVVSNAGYTGVRVRALSMQSGSVSVKSTRGFAVIPQLSGAFCNGLLHAAGKC